MEGDGKDGKLNQKVIENNVKNRKENEMKGEQTEMEKKIISEQNGKWKVSR